MKYKYEGFISYSHKDEKEAAYVQNHLEQYQVSKKQRIFPIFRDKTDAVGGKLTEILYGELAASRFLIVICSPNSARSEWVNREVAFFIKNGRADAIIPIVLGEDKEEHYPKALLEEPEVRARAILLKEKDYSAIVRAAARILNLEEAVLLQQYHFRRRVKRIIAAVLTLTCIGLSGGLMWYLIPHSQYYKTVSYQYDLPVGDQKLSADERKQEPFCYKITTQRGRVRTLEQVDAQENCVSVISPGELPNIPKVNYYYDYAGMLEKTEEYDSDGNIFQVKKYSGQNQIIEFCAPYDESRASAWKKLTLTENEQGVQVEKIEKQNEISRIVKEYDAQGYCTKETYFYNNLNTPIADETGAYGRLFERNNDGQEPAVICLDRSGNVSKSRRSNENTAQNYFYNLTGEREVAENGVVYHYDEMGRLVEEDYVDEQGQLTENARRYAKAIYTYDNRSNVNSVSFYDAQNQPAFTTEGYYSSRKMEYNDEQLLTQTSYFDRQGLLCNYIQRLDYNEYDQCSMISYLDQNHKYTKGGQGYAQCEIQYDESGNEINRIYYDESGYQIEWTEDASSCDSFEMRHENDWLLTINNSQPGDGDVFQDQDQIVRIGDWDYFENPDQDLLIYEIRRTNIQEMDVDVLRKSDNGSPEIMRLLSQKGLCNLNLQFVEISPEQKNALMSARSRFQDQLTKWAGMLLNPAQTDWKDISGRNYLTITGQDIGVLGNHTITRADIYSIEILDSLEYAGEDAWDVSAMKDGSVLAWLTNHGRYYDLHIAAEGGVTCNPDSQYLFAHFDQAVQINLGDAFDTSQCKNMGYLFADCPQLESIIWKHPDTECVTDMSHLFWNNKVLNKVPVKEFRTQNVSDMSGMFGGCEALDEIELDGFDTSSVTDMAQMFSLCRNLKILDLSHFQTENVTSFYMMFFACEQLNKLKISNQFVLDAADSGTDKSLPLTDVFRFTPYDAPDSSTEEIVEQIRRFSS